MGVFNADIEHQSFAGSPLSRDSDGQIFISFEHDLASIKLP